ncbi:MAG: DNA-protecting protein DprA [Bacteroidetes bacterium]|nr:MAG: DNA-protecting protein DprA [Bacteroidota bacterium]
MSKFYELALTFLPNIGAVLSKQLVSYCGSAEKIFQVPKTKLLQIPNIGNKIADSILNFRQNAIELAKKEAEKIDKLGTKIVSYSDPEYPKRLLEIPDSPTLLYLQGNINLNVEKTVAIVGSRKATNYGKKITEEIVFALKKHNALIVSGLAYGIDIYSHRAALENQMATVGVMATGIDVLYPAVHKETALEMQKKGGLITEYAIGTKPDAMRFPNRNRIIAALADVVIVVEAAASGGALITAEIANSYNKEVFAVPNDIHKPFSEGCNQLIVKHKAHLFSKIEDLEYIMNWEFDPKSKKSNKKSIILPEMTTEELQIYTLLDQKKAMHLDELSWQAQINVSRLAGVLLSLEMKNLVKSLPGKLFSVE